jgi:hypothetical protein
VNAFKLFNICSALLASAAASPPHAAPPDKASAIQALGVTDADATATSAVWNGQPTLFVNYVIDKSKLSEVDPVAWDEPPSQHVDAFTGERDKEVRRLVAVQRGPDGKVHSTVVTDIQSDAGFAGFAGIGFANADRDRRDRELIVLVQWDQRGGVGGGQEYQVRLFKRPEASKPFLPVLKKVSDYFGVQYEGRTFDTGEQVHAKFRTIKDVKRELKRLGY